MRPEWETAYLAAVLCLNTTARSCALNGLQWSDADLFAKTLTIRMSKTAAGERIVHLTNVAVSALGSLRRRTVRHCAVTQLAESGASDSTIMAIAGNVSRRMLERYSQVRMEAKRKAMEALGASNKMAGYDTDAIAACLIC
jgi:hypothetical protein